MTADHGGLGAGHADPRRYADYRVPFLVWGPGVPAGADLYALNPTYADPGNRRVGYAAALQPVRNGDVGNLVLDVLGLPAIPHSELDAAQDLEVFATDLRSRPGDRPAHLAQSSPRSGHGLCRQPARPLDCCIITGARRPGPGQPRWPWPSQWPVSWLTTRWR